jgi:NitT/TauT family transport system ATP-binding protein
MSHRPSTISRVVETRLARPRNPVETREDPVFLHLRHDLLSTLLDRKHGSS